MQLNQFITQSKKEHKTIVLVTGVFDVLHDEHFKFLQKAKETADLLIIAIESDVRVKKIKGPGRPIFKQRTRVQQLEKLGIADFVFILPEEFDNPQDHVDLISNIRPDVLAVSSHTRHLDKKRQIVEKFGGVLKVVHQHNPDLSSSILINTQ